MVIVHGKKSMNAWMVFELSFRLSVEEKEATEGNLCEMGLILIVCIDLLDCIFFTWRQMKGLPNKRKSSFAYSFLSHETLNKVFLSVLPQ